jgi:predicted kinase
VLIILAGLPGSGKTTIARELSRALGAVHVRIDSIEQAIRDAGIMVGDLRDSGYRAGYAIAEDNLRLGRTVVADSVNPLLVSRDAWIEVAQRAQVEAIEVEIECSDREEHRRRVEERLSDLPGLLLPTWEQVVSRAYDPWTRKRMVVDTASKDVAQSIQAILELLPRPRT